MISKEREQKIIADITSGMNFSELHVGFQTEAICLAAIRQDIFNLQYVEEQTEAICLAAVNHSGYALNFIEEQTEAICLAAVKRSGWALLHVYWQTEAICLAAVKQTKEVLQYVREPYKKVCEDYLSKINDTDAGAVEIVEQKVEQPNKCQCGAASINSSFHSTWCCKYEQLK